VDPYRIRNAARVGAVFMFIVFMLVISAMQRKLASIAGGQDPRHAAGARFNPSREAEEAALRLLGVPAAVVAGSDLDGDGLMESLVEYRAGTGREDLGVIARIAVLSPSADGSHRLLFDSARPDDLPRTDLATGLWHPDLLTLTRMELRASDSAGQPLDYRVEVTWSSESKRYTARRLGVPAEAAPAEATPAEVPPAPAAADEAEVEVEVEAPPRAAEAVTPR
jgi:hypothetical protein